MIVIGVDPGETTGLFVYDSDSGSHDHEQLRGTEYVLQWVNDRVDIADTEIAMERFVLGTNTARYTRHPQTMHVIHAIDSLFSTSHVTVTLQTASEAKSFAPNALLRRIGWYARSMPHANDAARHALLRLARRNLNEFDHLLGYRP